MYIYVYLVYMHMHMHIYIYISYVNIYIYVYMYTHVYIYIHTHLHVTTTIYTRWLNSTYLALCTFTSLGNKHLLPPFLRSKRLLVISLPLLLITQHIVGFVELIKTSIAINTLPLFGSILRCDFSKFRHELWCVCPSYVYV